MIFSLNCLSCEICLFDMILDNPIKTKEDDLLNREPVAIRIAEQLSRFCSDGSSESLVVGIEGDWGSGKTSLINLVLENLEFLDVLIIKFNPWNFSDQNELITDFFNSITDVLEQTEKEKGEKIAEKIKHYSSKLLKGTEISVAPEISFSGINLKFGSIYNAGGEKTLEKQKETINNLLKEIDKRIVIVIDDIDRLDSQETRLVLKLVKMTANFENTIFLLAYDRGRVGKMIKDKGIPGEEFLKKIVQLSFPLPRVDQQDLFRILFREIDEMIKPFDNNLWDQHRWEDLFESGLKKLFPTVRDIKRYINSLRVDLKVVGKEEVNPVDFLGIEAIRVFAPDVYFAIAKEKRIFAFPATDKVYKIRDPLPFPGAIGLPNDLSQDPSKRKDIFEEIIKKSSESLSDTIKEVIRKLFPQIENLYSDEPHNNWEQELDDWTHQLRVCSGAVFDKYFSLAIVSSTISEKALGDFLTKIDDRPASAEKLKKFQQKGKLNLLIERLLGNLDGFRLSTQQLENLLIVLFDFREDVFAVELSNLSYRIVGLGLKISEIIPKENRVESLMRILNSTNDIYRSTWLIDEITTDTIEYEKANEYEQTKLPYGNLFTMKEVRSLNKICAEKIKREAEGGSLQNEEKPGYLFSYWKKWESEEPVKEYFAKLLETKEGLFFLLKAYSDGRNIQKELIEEFIDIKKVDEKVEQLDVSSLEREKAELIKLYLNSS